MSKRWMKAFGLDGRSDGRDVDSLGGIGATVDAGESDQGRNRRPVVLKTSPMGRSRPSCDHSGPNIKVYVLEVGYGRVSPRSRWTVLK